MHAIYEQAKAVRVKTSIKLKGSPSQCPGRVYFSVSRETSGGTRQRMRGASPRSIPTPRLM